jgi:RecA-family ATPase
MSPVVVTETRESLLARRDAILEALGLSLEDFRTLDETRTLTGEEWEAREELDEIAFLLGE